MRFTDQIVHFTDQIAFFTILCSFLGYSDLETLLNSLILQNYVVLSYVLDKSDINSTFQGCFYSKIAKFLKGSILGNFADRHQV